MVGFCDQAGKSVQPVDYMKLSPARFGSVLNAYQLLSTHLCDANYAFAHQSERDRHLLVGKRRSADMKERTWLAVFG